MTIRPRSLVDVPPEEKEPPIERTWRYQILAAVIFLIFISLLFIYPAIYVGFLSDDWHALSIAASDTPLWKFFGTNIIGTREGSTYGPMWNVLFETEYSLFGLHAAWYHAVSILLLASTVWVVYRFTTRILERGDLGFAAGMIFLFLPNHVEPVAWIAGQPHLLASLSFLVAVYCYYLFVSDGGKKWHAFSIAAFSVSIFTKEIGISAIPIFFLLEMAYGKQERLRDRAWVALPHLLAPLLILAIYISLRAWATGVLFGYYGNASLSVPLADAWRTIAEIIASMALSFPWRRTVAEWAVVYPAIPVVLAIAAIFTLLRMKTLWRKHTMVLVGSFLLSLVPYARVQFNALTNEGERYGYLPSIFFAMLIPVLVGYAIPNKGYNRRRTAIAFAVMAMVMQIGLPQIINKFYHWVEATSLTQKTFRSFEDLSIPPNAHIILVGLPDTIAGAQTLRNGTREALFFQKGISISADRVLMSPLLLPIAWKQTAVEPSREGDEIVLESPNNRFTGLPVQKTAFGTATLVNFRRSDQTGERIVFGIDQSAVAEATRNNIPVFLVYFSEGEFRALALY